MKLNWQINETATVLHVAAAVGRGLPLSDPRILPAVETSVAALQTELRLAGVSAEVAWSGLCRQACRHTDIGHVVRAALPMVAREEDTARQERLIHLVAAIGEGLREVLPGLADELHHRSRPLREQWEARGPGLLSNVRRCLGSRWHLDQASVFVVHPVLGGGGGIDAVHSSAWIEALLANPIPGLPEVVRLGWLLGRLACHRMPDTPARQPTRPRRLVVELAMVPATLAAAETVELARGDAETVHQAIAAWHQPAAEQEAPFVGQWAQVVWQWWQAREAGTPWDRALVELDERIAECR